jgi:hypothetical protein
MAEQGHPDGEGGHGALLSEEAQETEKALSLYREIQNWNPAYRRIADKVSSLEKPVA